METFSGDFGRNETWMCGCRMIEYGESKTMVRWGMHVAVLLVLLVGGPQTVVGQGECNLFADVPVVEQTNAGGSISGVGHRECSGSLSASVGVTVRIKRDRTFWFDKTLASKSGNATPNIELPAVYTCKGRDSIKVYTQIVAGGRKEESRRKNTSLCSQTFVRWQVDTS